MIIATTIEPIKNLVDLEYFGSRYDLHNDYCCELVEFKSDKLIIVFNKREKSEPSKLNLTFFDVDLMSLRFFNTPQVENLTIDSLYRGRVVVGSELMDQSSDGRGYFYIEFYEGQKFEFWSKGFAVELK